MPSPKSVKCDNPVAEESTWASALEERHAQRDRAGRHADRRRPTPEQMRVCWTASAANKKSLVGRACAAGSITAGPGPFFWESGYWRVHGCRAMADPMAEAGSCGRPCAAGMGAGGFRWTGLTTAHPRRARIRCHPQPRCLREGYCRRRSLNARRARWSRPRCRQGRVQNKPVCARTAMAEVLRVPKVGATPASLRGVAAPGTRSSCWSPLTRSRSPSGVVGDRRLMGVQAGPHLAPLGGKNAGPHGGPRRLPLLPERSGCSGVRPFAQWQVTVSAGSSKPLRNTIRPLL